MQSFLYILIAAFLLVWLVSSQCGGRFLIDRGGGARRSATPRFLEGGYSSRPLGGSTKPYLFMTSFQTQEALNICVKETIVEVRNVTLMLDKARNLTESEAETNCAGEQRWARILEIVACILIFFIIVHGMASVVVFVISFVRLMRLNKAERERKREKDIQLDDFKGTKRLPYQKEETKISLKKLVCNLKDCKSKSGE
ncbi:unnamed protein product [Bursaphelenchus okinawaensis]|uniref:Uncharacterized protein n=1 Tax=Bursaphelenchus okinawaensis TaxID=465554 RepID=A0A811L8N8_9BILA|nr:unnamed protein product [Bursaphelenchus okinawaensis]CAG9119345.1 unnamed protein product [Bursaphelenchus okinawaensis]